MGFSAFACADLSVRFRLAGRSSGRIAGGRRDFACPRLLGKCLQPTGHVLLLADTHGFLDGCLGFCAKACLLRGHLGIRVGVSGLSCQHRIARLLRAVSLAGVGGPSVHRIPVGCVSVGKRLPCAVPAGRVASDPMAVPLSAVPFHVHGRGCETGERRPGMATIDRAGLPF